MNKEEKKIVKVIQDKIEIPEDIETKLTKEERRTLEKVKKWLNDNIKKLEFDSVTIGFPSGISITLKKKR